MSTTELISVVSDVLRFALAFVGILTAVDQHVRCLESDLGQSQNTCALHREVDELDWTPRRLFYTVVEASDSKLFRSRYLSSAIDTIDQQCRVTTCRRKSYRGGQGL